MKNTSMKEKAGYKGEYVIRTYKTRDRINAIASLRGLPKWYVKMLDLIPTAKELSLMTPIYVSPVIANKVVSSTGGYGRNIVIRQLSNDTTYPIAITLGAIGTGSATPADSDTGLGAQVLGSIAVTDRVISNDSVTLTFFITDGTLANGTYAEWGIFCATRLFARSLITPTYAKASGQDTTISHVVTLS